VSELGDVLELLYGALVEREGTCVELSSQTYTPDALAELALSLVPAPTERPPLVG
jgi:hypothetical protein